MENEGRVNDVYWPWLALLGYMSRHSTERERKKQNERETNRSRAREIDCVCTCVVEVHSSAKREREREIGRRESRVVDRRNDDRRSR